MEVSLRVAEAPGAPVLRPPERPPPRNARVGGRRDHHPRVCRVDLEKTQTKNAGGRQIVRTNLRRSGGDMVKGSMGLQGFWRLVSHAKECVNGL